LSKHAARRYRQASPVVESSRSPVADHDAAALSGKLAASQIG